MTQAERRHDRLAVRLSLIISRLVAGETLSVRKLAAEFGVSVRTLRRDFRERLMYLDWSISPDIAAYALRAVRRRWCPTCLSLPTAAGWPVFSTALTVVW